MIPVGKKVLDKHGPPTGKRLFPFMHGLAPKPPPQTPSSIFPAVEGADAAVEGFAAAVEGADSAVDAPIADISDCRKCIALQSTLKLAFEKLHESQTRVQAAVTLCTEAAERSNAKIDAYDALYRIYTVHGTPFQNGARLPKEFRRNYPLHPQEDDMREDLHEGNADPKIKGKARQLSPCLNPSDQLDLHHEDDTVDARGRQDSSRGSSPLTEESEESIPAAFQDLDSHSTDDESSILSDIDSEADAPWELDPDEE
jgi:hypothetical protein